MKLSLFTGTKGDPCESFQNQKVNFVVDSWIHFAKSMQDSKMVTVLEKKSLRTLNDNIKRFLRKKNVFFSFFSFPCRLFFWDLIMDVAMARD